MYGHAHRPIESVVIGDGQHRTFVIGHAFASVDAVDVCETGDKDVSVDVAHLSRSQVMITFDRAPVAGKPFLIHLSGRER